MSVNVVLENLKDKMKYKKYHIIVMVSSFDMRNLEKDSEKYMKKSLVWLKTVIFINITFNWKITI